MNDDRPAGSRSGLTAGQVLGWLAVATGVAACLYAWFGGDFSVRTGRYRVGGARVDAMIHFGPAARLFVGLAVLGVAATFAYCLLFIAPGRDWSKLKGNRIYKVLCCFVLACVLMTGILRETTPI